MARFIQAARRMLLSSSSKTLIHGLPGNQRGVLFHSRGATSTFFLPSKPYATDVVGRSPFETNVLRILRNEIEYQSEYAPPHQPAAEFKLFTVEDHPGEQWITMRGKFGDNEHIKMEATMFDGYESIPKVGEDSTEEDLRLHISVLVDIFKGEGSDAMEFVCSAWPDCIEIQKVYMLNCDKMQTRPYMGPDFRSLKSELQRTLCEFLRARGVNDELSFFLHEYMMNKDRIELIRWLRNVKSLVEK